MTAGELWWKRLHEGLSQDPVYLAEGISLDISLQVSRAIRASGLTRKDLAERLGVSQPYVSQILGGPTNLTILTLCKLAVALGLRPSIRLDWRDLRGVTAESSPLSAAFLTRMLDASGVSGAFFCSEEVPGQLPRDKSREEACESLTA
jgi:transcriptional regulator with XRE-family HTH domain